MCIIQTPVAYFFAVSFHAAIIQLGRLGLVLEFGLGLMLGLWLVSCYGHIGARISLGL